MALEKGITVLICTYNGFDNLPKTLDCITKQKHNNVPLELLIVDNASTDEIGKKIEPLWESMDSDIPMKFHVENKPGKSHAIDKGLNLAVYQYVIICDDDNWLDEHYVSNAFEIMSANPNIGMLGGQGHLSDKLNVPEWLHNYKKYYAIGTQGFVNGEIKHFWPSYRFLWGAGAVINREAILLLKECGFERILTHENVGKLARSEDLELCFAIWLTGYKLWYDNKLTYQHDLDPDRLTWNSFMEIVKISVPALHYLRPYNILIFSGAENAPSKSYWKEHLNDYHKLFGNYFKSEDDFKAIAEILNNQPSQNSNYMMRLNIYYQLIGALKLGKGYDDNFQKIKLLQSQLSARIKNYEQINIELQ